MISTRHAPDQELAASWLRRGATAVSVTCAAPILTTIGAGLGAFVRGRGWELSRGDHRHELPSISRLGLIVVALTGAFRGDARGSKGQSGLSALVGVTILKFILRQITRCPGVAMLDAETRRSWPKPDVSTPGRREQLAGKGPASERAPFNFPPLRAPHIRPWLGLRSAWMLIGVLFLSGCVVMDTATNIMHGPVEGTHEEPAYE